MHQEKVIIRKGTKEDLPGVLKLIRELAAYERALHEVTNTVEQLERDGFGHTPLYGLFVAELNSTIVGMALFYWRYSTWKGKRLYLEDIIVTEAHRGKGIGTELFDRIIHHALEEQCTGMMWQVLNWNESALSFYTKRYGARLDNEWINCHLEKEEMEQLVQRKKN